MAVIHWFRNDLRLTDNPAFQHALSSGEDVVPVYVFDERQWAVDRWGHRKTGAFRTQFLLESVRDLSEALEDAGSGLLVRIGKPEEVLLDLADEWDVQSVFAQAEYTPEEHDAESAVAQHFRLSLAHGSTLYHPEDLPFSTADLPEVFTPFRKKTESRASVRPVDALPEVLPLADLDSDPIPQLADFGLSHDKPDPRAALPFKGGSTEAWARLDHYFWDTECLSTYKATRNGLVGADYSSKFSPWLSNGSLSPREVYWEIQQYESDVEANQSTYWLIFELLWRDYFKCIAMKHGNRLFWPSGLKGERKKWLTNENTFEQWRTGQTSDAFVNANMRELLHTGWMSNRGRQNVASYLVHDLGLDWRMGASWFESQLLDYDPASNYGNWNYVAGVGNDPREGRRFNTVRQAEMYDAEGAFRALWSGQPA